MQGALSGLPAAPSCYEELLAAEADREAGFRWVEVDENDACGLCYTSGTTGRPKARAPRRPGWSARALALLAVAELADEPQSQYLIHSPAGRTSWRVC